MSHLHMVIRYKPVGRNFGGINFCKILLSVRSGDISRHQRQVGRLRELHCTDFYFQTLLSPLKSSSMTNLTFSGPRETPSLAVLCQPSLSNAGRPPSRILLLRNKQCSNSPFVFPVGVAKPFTRRLSLQLSPCRHCFPRHRPPSALPPSASLRDWRPPNSAYRPRVSDFAVYRFCRTASIGTAPQEVGIRDAEAKLRDR